MEKICKTDKDHIFGENRILNRFKFKTTCCLIDDNN